MLIRKGLLKYITNIWVVYWLLCNASFLLIEPIYYSVSAVNTYNNKLMVTVYAIEAFVIYLLVYGKEELRKLRTLHLLTLTIVFGVTMIMVLQVLIGQVGLSDAASDAYHYFVLLGIFGLLPTFSSKKGAGKLIQWIMIIGVIFAVCNIVCFIWSNLYNQALSSVPLYQKIANQWRLPQSSDFVGFTAVLFMAALIDRKKISFKLAVGLAICVFELIFVAQVRMIVLAVALSFAVMLYNKTKDKRVWILAIVFLCIGLVLDYAVNKQISAVAMFLGEGERYNSAVYRLEEFLHFSKYIFKNILFGFGFSQDSTILQYSITDVGILGFLSRFGLIGLVWLLFFVKYLIRKFVTSENSFSKGLVIFLIMCFISLNPFDPQRACMLPFALVIIDANKNEYHMGDESSLSLASGT